MGKRQRRKLSTARSRTELITNFASETPIVALAAPVSPPPAAGGGGDAPAANPAGPDKAIDNNLVCADDMCGHYASAHADDPEMGVNSGACGMQDCACQGMQVAEDNAPDVPPAEGTPVAAAGVIPVDSPIPSPTNPTLEDGGAEQNPPPPVEGGDSMGPQFTIPVAIIEGQPTGDGRQIAVDALTWRVPPLPLMGLATETHDPEGYDPNSPAVICGRIDSFARTPGEGSTMLISAQGFYLPNEDGMYFAELNEAMGRLGVSADVAVNATEITIGDIDDDGWPTDMAETLTEGTIMGLTVCPYPAFEGAYIVLGDGTDPAAAEAIPQQAELQAAATPTEPPNLHDAEDTGPSCAGCEFFDAESGLCSQFNYAVTADQICDAYQPVGVQEMPATVAAGGQLIHFMTYDECVPCDQGIEVIAASGAGPTRPPEAWFQDPAFLPEDGRLVEILDKRGQRAVGGKYACPITVTASGQVFGHIAPWGICHTGTSGQCILAPKSAAGYAHFKRGQHLVTAEGSKVRVGVLTADTGHASTRPGLSAAAAMAHYDNTALAVADVNVGEDEYGIWVAGAIRSDATEEQIRTLTASSLSGDWRSIGGQLELVAALAVNQPGFPLAVVASGQIESLVAAGGNVMHRLKHPRESGQGEDVVLRAALQPLLSTAAGQARDRIAALSARS